MSRKEKKKEKIERGLKEEDVYTEEGIEELGEEDQISETEEAFMEGYEDGKLAKCPNCGKILKDDVYEEEFDEEIYRFCSEECARNFEKNYKKRKRK